MNSNGLVTTARRRTLAVACIAVACTVGSWGQVGGSTNICQSPDTVLVGERSDRLALVDPATLEVRDSQVSAGFALVATSAQNDLTWLSSSRWYVTRLADERGRTIRVVDSSSGEVVFDERFDLRIELATSSVSPSGRFTVYLQSNNIASELTILDASDGSRRTLTIAHDAPLAAFALAITLSPNELCAAVSMERIGGHGAETWLLNLLSGEITQVNVPDLFVLDWAPT